MMGESGRAASRIHYSQCWEDVAVARTVLQVPAGGRVLAIGAAGDNVLAMLVDDPAHILAVDINPAQTALLELKRAAFRALPPEEVASFVGAIPEGANHDPRRLTRFESLRRHLSPDAARFWDARPADLSRGVIHSGRFERYLGTFRRWILPLAPGRATVRAMLRAADPGEQQRIYRERWDTWRWRMLFRSFFSRRLLAAFGRYPTAFAQATVDDVGRHFLDRARVGLTATPLARNPFVTYVLTGGFREPDALPDYLRPDTAPLIGARTDRIEVRTQSLLDVLSELPDRSIDAFYLSDVFELFDANAYKRALVAISRVGRRGARLCYWNNLVDRRRPRSLAGLLDSHEEFAARLHRNDRAFLYSRLVVESVRARSGPRRDDVTYGRERGSGPDRRAGAQQVAADVG